MYKRDFILKLARGVVWIAVNAEYCHVVDVCFVVIYSSEMFCHLVYLLSIGLHCR